MNYLEQINTIYTYIKNADNILIGAGAGLTAAGGINYASEEYFKENFPQYYNLGLHNIAEAQSSLWRPTKENYLKYWAYWASHIKKVRYDTPALEPYKLLFKLLKDKKHFVITTNVDGQFVKSGFSKENVFAPQGEYAYNQCYTPCSQNLYHNEKTIKNMLKNSKNPIEINKEDAPYCPNCGEMMTPNLRIDHTFIEKESFNEYKKYTKFLEDGTSSKFLLLEFGVGFNTPSIIRYPFEHVISAYPHAFLVRFNKDFPEIPNVLTPRALGVSKDINEVLKDLIKEI